MRTLAAVLVAVVTSAGLPNRASADVLNMGGTRNPDGSWNGLASLETVPVGNAGNMGELSGAGVGGHGTSRVCGAVSYTYDIGKYEVTTGQYCEFLNKVAGVDTYGLYDTSMWSDAYGCKIEQFAGDGTADNPYQYRVAADYANRPVNYVSFGDACRFANWLHNSQPSGLQNSTTTEDGAYYLNGATSDEALAAVTRKASWKWALTSEDEWYKAAYYNPATGGYYDYPTSSNSLPSNDVLTPDGGNNADLWQNDWTIDSPYYRTLVGEFELSASPYGTFDQGGNVAEWNESLVGSSVRCLRGGSFAMGDGAMLWASNRGSHFQSLGHAIHGFRVVQVPEPTTVAVLALGGLLIARRRRA